MNYLALMVVSLLFVFPNEAIIDGITLFNHRAPFVVKMIFKNDSGEFRTTGILVHPQFVLLSARRCVNTPPFEAYMGLTIFHAHSKPCPVSTKTFIHPEFKDFSHAFCLVRMEKPFKISNSIQVAELAGLPEPLPKKLTVAAWGYYKVDPRYVIDYYLLAAPAIIYENCMEQYDPKYFGTDVICIGNTKQIKFKTVHGDEGGAIFSPITNKVHAMVVNFFELHENDLMPKPTLANMVSFDRDWILKTINTNKLNTTEYCPSNQ